MEFSDGRFAKELRWWMVRAFLWRGRRWTIEVGLIVLGIPDMDCKADWLFKHSTNASS